MITDNDIAKLILGFKVRRLRLLNKTSYQTISNETGLSVSYLNDIEKGKKYPKPDKITRLAKVFDLEYDELVSLKSDKKLQPVIELLNSDFFKHFPLEEFGVSLEKLIDVFSNSPDRFSAIISTVLKMTRRYQIEQEQFYRIALRSFQDIHDNYFSTVEEAVKQFRAEQKTSIPIACSPGRLEVLLKSYGIRVDMETLAKHEKLSSFRSYYQPEKKLLYINKALTENQVRFLLAKELGFHVLGIDDRPLETELDRGVSFDKLFNNFRSSYFAASLLMEESEMVSDIREMARNSDWSPDLISSLLEKYQVTPETLFQRLTNLLPHHFDIKDLFFIKLNSTKDIVAFDITKELHLSRLQSPYQNELNEHLCQRWVSISAIKNIRTRKSDYLIDAQTSNYWQTNRSYFCISVAQPAGFNQESPGSITLGLLMSEKVKATFNFVQDPSIKEKTVNTTCERCSVFDCGSRVAAPTYIEKKDFQEMLAAELSKL